jgi:putative OPT family oligopeptide transporter
MPEFQPFVAPSENRPEFTVRALLLGSVFGIIFGMVTVYVGLRAGLTVAASIPISVLSISILRAFGRASILENNIVQTTGNAGQSIASGVIFTLPALVFLGFDLEYSRIFMLALIGGWLGVLFMIPLRRQLIVQEHGVLPYPEGTACADVLIAGEKGGSMASRVFLGLGLGGLYTLLQNGNLFKAWPEAPEYRLDFGPQHAMKGAEINADATSEYLGVGYIIGPKVAGVIVAGGVFSWLVVMPLIYFFGKELAASGVSGPGADRADEPAGAVGHLHQADGRGRGSGGGADYAGQDAAHNSFGSDRGLQDHAPRRGRRGGKAIAHGERSLHGRGADRLAGDRCSDVHLS